MQTAHYGYSQRYANFPDEIMPPLGQFGGGCGTGDLFLQDGAGPKITAASCSPATGAGARSTGTTCGQTAPLSR